MPRKKVKKRGATRRGPRAVRRSGRPSALANATVEDLQLEIERRKEAMLELQARRDELIDELSEVEQNIDVYAELFAGTSNARSNTTRRPARSPGRRTGRRPGRPKGSTNKRAGNKMTLVDALAKVLKNKTLSVADAVDAVQAAGYTSNSKTFRTIVNQALISHPKKFKKIARGQYTSK